MNHRQLNHHLADLLGVPWRDQPVTGFTLHVQADNAPRLIVQMLPHGDRPQPAARCFDLHPIAPPAAPPAQPPAGLDLEAMANTARARVAAHIEASAEAHLHAMDNAFKRALARLWIVD